MHKTTTTESKFGCMVSKGGHRWRSKECNLDSEQARKQKYILELGF